MNIIPTEANDELAIKLLHYPIEKKHAEICHRVLTAYGSRKSINVRCLQVLKILSEKQGLRE